jgi:adenine-specific DNA methylase
MMYRNREFSRSNVRVWIFAALVGTILIGCTNSTENKSSQKVETSDRDVRVENNQKVEVRGRNARTSSRSSVSTTNDGTATRSESIEENTEITQKDPSSNQIQNGRDWVGATDQDLEVQGDSRSERLRQR